jgi:ketosteroid isomerase-like protein
MAVMKRIFMVCLIGVISSCENALNKDVEAAMDKYDAMILHTDAKGIAAMFTEDGEMAAPGMPSIYGRDSIQKFLNQFSGIKVLEQKSTTDSIQWAGNTAKQYGTYYQRANINNADVEVNGMFQADWVTQPDGKLLLKRMSAWPVNK